MLVTVDVTPEDLSNGLPGNCGLCPVALAVRRIVRDDVAIRVSMSILSWRWPDYTTGSVDLPWTAENFIKRFDAACEIEPFEFEIDLPDELLAAVTS